MKTAHNLSSKESLTKEEKMILGLDKRVDMLEDYVSDLYKKIGELWKYKARK